jgi:ferrous-iron efflux pump FieF
MATATIPNSDSAGTLMQRAALAAIAAAAVLVLLKAAAWWWTGSVAMLASLADSGLDLLASGINAVAIRHALTPADREHRFGHGKAEAVAGLAQSALVAGSALFLSYESVRRILAPEPIAAEALGVAVMVVAMAATLALILYQRSVIRRSGSLAVAADRLHYLGDLAANAAVILALVLAGWLGWLWIDGVFGLVIAATIAWSAWSIARQAFDQLIDRELPDIDRARIKALAAAVPGVLDVHDLRTRASGVNVFVQLHIAVDAGLTVEAGHDISDAAEAAVLSEFPNAEILVHTDPSGVAEPHRPFAFVRG